MVRTSTRVKALYLYNIARFLENQGETEGDMAAIVRAQWATDQLPVDNIAAAEDPAVPPDDGIVSSALRGHVLGDLPDASVQVGDPDTSEAVTRQTAKLLATDRAFTADLILHSRTLRGMRSSGPPHDTFLAARVLSS